MTGALRHELPREEPNHTQETGNEDNRFTKRHKFPLRPGRQPVKPSLDRPCGRLINAETSDKVRRLIAIRRARNIP